jgi:SAM-dependent methyltransferase
VSLPDPEKNARFHSRIAPEYDARMAKDPGNVWIRRAFRQVVKETIAPGSLLLDFGSGTGEDSLWYAQQGYRVLAYDNASGMMAELERKCSREIVTGQIIPLYADYDRFPDVLQREERPQAVVSNFAALNHVRELQPLFSIFAAHLEPPGQIIASVLNPLFWQDLIHPWWWRPLARGIRTGHISCVWEEVSSYRHFMGPIARAARPHFVKIGQAGVGTFPRFEKLDARFHRSFPFSYLGKFIFLIFQLNALRGEGTLPHMPLERTGR